LYEGIRSFVLSARQSAARGVNLLQVYTNYEIGRRIFEKKSREPTALNMARNSSGIWLPG
jgi:hypothetical protein